MTAFFIIAISILPFSSAVIAPRFCRNLCVSPVVEANTKFAVDLFKTCAKEVEGKLFLSPFSVSVALAMTYSGSAGNTKKQLQKAMHLTGINDIDVHENFGHLLKEIEKSDKYKNITKLSLANRLFAAKSYRFLPDFLRTSRMYYDAENQNLDFVNDAAGAERLINNWVEEKTQNKIKDLIPPNTLDWMTKLVIVNTLYFRSDWETKFYKKKTRDDYFYNSKGKAISVRFMSHTLYIVQGTNKELQCDFLQIPYYNRALFMNIYLPYSSSNITNLERNLKFEHISDEVNMFSLDELYTDLFLPRFEVKSSFNLNSVLGSLGMTDLFNHADLSKMDLSGSLSVSDVMHQAFIDVNEDGKLQQPYLGGTCIA